MTDEMLQQLFRTAAESYDGPVDGDGLRAVFEAGRSAGWDAADKATEGAVSCVRDNPYRGEPT